MNIFSFSTLSKDREAVCRDADILSTALYHERERLRSLARRKLQDAADFPGQRVFLLGMARNYVRDARRVGQMMCMLAFLDDEG